MNARVRYIQIVQSKAAARMHLGFTWDEDEKLV